MDREDRIRERAHRIWEEEGRPEGRHHEHWQRACQEIDQPSAQSSVATQNPAGRTQSSARPQTPTGNSSGAPEAASTGSSGLVGADDVGVGAPDAMGVDDLNVAGRISDPTDSRPTTGHSKLVGS